MTMLFDVDYDDDDGDDERVGLKLLVLLLSILCSMGYWGKAVVGNIVVIALCCWCAVNYPATQALNAPTNALH